MPTVDRCRVTDGFLHYPQAPPSRRMPVAYVICSTSRAWPDLS